jgi:phytoene synthase
MTALLQHWENRLLHLAYEALDSTRPIINLKLADDARQAAYAHCADLTAAHSKTFTMASGLLPEPKREAARALYAFCRITDDIIDNAPDDTSRALALDDWQQIALTPFPPKDNPVAVAWADARVRYNIPDVYARQLIEGCARDLVQTRYATFADLAEYAYGVASTVGLMSMHIIGFSGEEAIPYAIKLGVALQLTNILRDVSEDWAQGRVYLPQDEMAYFGVHEADIAAGQVTPAWRDFMRYQIQRNRTLYEEAWPGIGLLNADGRLAIAAAADLYKAILDDIEVHDYDVFNRRAHLSKMGKLSRLPGIWWRSRRVGRAAPVDRVR